LPDPIGITSSLAHHFPLPAWPKQSYSLPFHSKLLHIPNLCNTTSHSLRTQVQLVQAQAQARAPKVQALTAASPVPPPLNRDGSRMTGAVEELSNLAYMLAQVSKKS
jgi:hypothetical protein